MDHDKVEQARILYHNSDKSAREACSLFGFSRRTHFGHLRKIQQINDAQDLKITDCTAVPKSCLLAQLR